MIKNFVTYLMAKFSGKKGQGMVEYGLILALVAVVVIVALGALGGGLGNIFNTVTTKLSGV